MSNVIAQGKTREKRNKVVQIIGGWLLLIYGRVKKFGTVAWWGEKEERRVGLAVSGSPVCLYRTFCLVHKLKKVNLRASECPADAGSSEASINVISFHVLREHNQSCVHTLLFNWHWMCTPPSLVVTGRKTCSATSSHTHILTYSVSVVFWSGKNCLLPQW